VEQQNTESVTQNSDDALSRQDTPVLGSDFSKHGNPGVPKDDQNTLKDEKLNRKATKPKRGKIKHKKKKKSKKTSDYDNDDYYDEYEDDYERDYEQYDDEDDGQGATTDHGDDGYDSGHYHKHPSETSQAPFDEEIVREIHDEAAEEIREMGELPAIFTSN